MAGISKSGKPPCSEWDLWEGPEVEGTDGIGVKTLFVRRGEPAQILLLCAGYSRVWFCVEYENWSVVRHLLNTTDIEVCMEVTPASWPSLPGDIYHRARLYFKTGIQLKDGDHVAVGTSFHEELFRIGNGARVQVEDYFGDKRIQ